MEPESPFLPQEVYLEVLSGEREGERFLINRKTITIGRDPQCDLHIPDPFISRKHCQVVFRGDHFTVVDLGSLNKTQVKDKEYIQKNLKNGNVITLGKTQLRFVWENAKQWLEEQGIAEALLEGSDEADTGEREPGQ
jgi:pSer/pThr/pTyr-binding forkhead associated (FHA) protein